MTRDTPRTRSRTSRPSDRSPRPEAVSLRAPIAAGLAPLVACLVLAATLVGCGSDPVEPIEEPTVQAPDDPAVVAIVRVRERTAEIRDEDVARSLEFHRRAYPDSLEHQQFDLVFNSDLIPHAAARAHYAKLIPVRLVEIEEFEKKFREEGIRAGSLQQAWKFQDSEYRRSSTRWWALDDFRFSVQGLAAFDTPIGNMAEPFVTLAGIHLLYVKDRIESGAIERPTANIIEMIAQFEKPADIRTAADDVVRNARVVWIRDEYLQYVSPNFRF